MIPDIAFDVCSCLLSHWEALHCHKLPEESLIGQCVNVTDRQFVKSTAELFGPPPQIPQS